MSRSRRELSNEYLLEKIGFDTAENEPRQVCGTGRAHEGSLSSLTSLLLTESEICDRGECGFDDTSKNDRILLREEDNSWSFENATKLFPLTILKIHVRQTCDGYIISPFETLEFQSELVIYGAGRIPLTI